MTRKIPVLSLALTMALAILGTAVFAQAKGPLNFALSGNPDTLDPQTTSGTLTFQVVRSLYDTLVEPDKDGKIVPALAVSYSASADALTWTFNLRTGVLFQNGDKFTSADVKATFDRIRDPATASPKASEYKAITAIETPNPSTVVFKLSQPYSPFIATLASGWSAILPKGLIDSKNNFSANPVGTGPYKMKEWVRDNRIVLEKNPNYWMKGFPKLDRVNFNIIPEQAVEVQGLLTGDIDIIYLVNETDIPVLSGDPGTKLEKSMSALVQVMGINCQKPNLDNVKLRQAISMAIDKQQALDIAYAGGVPVATFMDVSDPYYKDFNALLPYNPDKARQLIKEANIPADRVFEMVLPQNYDPHVKAGQLYQEMLTKVGLKVPIKLVDWSTCLTDVYRGGKYDFTVIGHTGKLDPDGRLAGYGTDKTYVRWINAKYVELIDKAKTVAKFEDRKKLYDEATLIMAQEVPFVFVGTSYRYIGLRKDVSGFIMDTKQDTFDFRYTEKK
ncbi:MAG: ABC transporter substrate-binding protein [Spirochaetota bacterium]